ncbi:MAG: CBS domain-containing protein [bacterium]|nr:CBS domain-containing protein [bacterium]MDT8396524.1 CBS domain-containing protein [bacterium]
MVSSRRTAKDIMTTPVQTVRPADPLKMVIDLICRHRVSGVPVVEGKGRLVGLISERDILHALYPGDTPGMATGGRAGGDLKDINGLLARDIMITEVVTADPETDFLRLASIMSLEKIRRIPIVEGNTLVGIVSHGDVGRAIFGKPAGSVVCPAMHIDRDPPQGNVS